jgi:hypothetical protein
MFLPLTFVLHFSYFFLKAMGDDGKAGAKARADALAAGLSTGDVC